MTELGAALEKIREAHQQTDATLMRLCRKMASANCRIIKLEVSPEAYTEFGCVDLAMFRTTWKADVEAPNGVKFTVIAHADGTFLVGE